MDLKLSAIETNNDDDSIVIQNISNCINDKMSILNVKLTELSKDAGVDYFTLRKIVNKEIGYLPNLRVLIKLAGYLNIKVGDLLNYNDLPQYIPVIPKSQVVDFLSGKLQVTGLKNQVFSETYIHDKAFAVKELNPDLLIPAEIIYICYPNQNKMLVPDNVYLFNLSSNLEPQLMFGRLKLLNDENLEIIIGYESKVVNISSVIAIVIGMKMSESLI